jgi:uncharacterized glyoxalase superfamily protein PhnB
MERAVPCLPGDSVTVAKDFYVNRLGFTVAWETPSNGTEGMVGFKRGTIAITVDCPMSGHGRDACAVLEVDDADRYYDEWKDKVEMKRAPMNEEWGGRTFGVTDPFGNTIFVIGPTT